MKKVLGIRDGRARIIGYDGRSSSKAEGRKICVDFALRDLMKSCKGGGSLPGLPALQGQRMPHWVGIAGTIASPDFDHCVETDPLVFSPP